MYSNYICIFILCIKWCLWVVRLDVFIYVGYICMIYVCSMLIYIYFYVYVWISMYKYVLFSIIY